jgi:hypothetical protein
VVLEELLPAAWHRTDRYANNCIETDRGRLMTRLRPMRGLGTVLRRLTARLTAALASMVWVVVSR